jgi:uncharacterized repeat protein (TIGR03803 family)
LFGDTWLGGPTNAGVVFKVGPTGSAFTPLVGFNGTNGANVRGSLLQLGSTLYGTTNYGGGSLQSPNGVIFKVNADGSGFGVLGDGTTAYGGGSGYALLLGPDGRLYGVDTTGGSGRTGSLFALNPDGSGFETLHEFVDFADGRYPVAGLTLGQDGFLYGVTQVNGGVFKVSPGGFGFTILVNLFNANSRLIQGTDGALYGTTFTGGLNGVGMLFKVSPDGSHFVELYDFDGTNGSYPSGLTQASDGALYGTTFAGGANDYGVVFGIRTDGSGFAKLFDFDFGTTGGNSVAALLEASDGSFYGTAPNGGPSGGGVVFRFQGRLSPVAP